jgi:hypothetical protein
MKKYCGINGIKDILSLFSSQNNGYVPLRYYCMSCGKEHREIARPNCGSKMKRVG